MYHMIDACEYCGTFQRVTLEQIEENGDAHLVCPNCLSLFWSEDEKERELPKPVNYEKYKWKEVSSV